MWLAHVDPLQWAQSAEHLGIVGILVLVILGLLYLLREERKERRYWRDLAMQRRQMLDDSLDAAERAVTLAKHRRPRYVRQGAEFHDRRRATSGD